MATTTINGSAPTDAQALSVASALKLARHFGAHASTLALETAYPAADHPGARATVGGVLYESRGGAWVQVSGVTPAAVQAALAAEPAQAVAALGLPAAPAINHIGAPGRQGFGVGICPSPPAGYSLMPGTTDPASPNYGNYTYTDGSVMCWIPAYWYRIGHADNPTYSGWGVNSIDVLPLGAFADAAAAAAAGYAKPRAFRNAGADQPGFFVDKYIPSNNAGTASSLRNGAPLSTNAAHNPIGALTGAPANIYGGCFAAAKTRGSQFFPALRWMHVTLALLVNAHGQAASSTAHCQWWRADGQSQPRGCNNNALRDATDATVAWVSDGYSNCGRTGSATPFAASTHNGQACGVADLNGLMWEVSPGVTCVAVGKAITAAVAGNPVRLTVPAHGATAGQWAQIDGVGGMTQLNGKMWQVAVIDADTLDLTGVDGSAYSAYTSGGTLTLGTWYVLNETADAAALTGGNTLATDAWGATGLAAHSAPMEVSWAAGQPYDRRVGNGAAQVFAPDASGAAWLRTQAGMVAPAGIGASGITAFGQDYYYQYVRSELCPIAGGTWSAGSAAGAWAVYWYNARSFSYDSVGFRAASYL